MKSLISIVVLLVVARASVAQYSPPSAPMHNSIPLPVFQSPFASTGGKPRFVHSSRDLEKVRLEKISNRVLAQRVWINGTKEYKLLLLEGLADMEDLKENHLSLMRKHGNYKEARGGYSPLTRMSMKKTKLSQMEFEITRAELESQLAIKAIEIQAEVERIYPQVRWEKDRQGCIIRPIFP